jgi:hypothetical protein
MTFQAGTSGNPKGRPKGGKALSEVLRKYLAQPVQPDDERPRALILAERLWELTDKSIDPDVRLSAIKYVYDRTDGKPAESTQVSGPGGAPIPLSFVEVVRPAENDEVEDGE